MYSNFEYIRECAQNLSTLAFLDAQGRRSWRVQNAIKRGQNGRRPVRQSVPPGRASEQTQGNAGEMRNGRDEGGAGGGAGARKALLNAGETAPRTLRQSWAVSGPREKTL